MVPSWKLAREKRLARAEGLTFEIADTFRDGLSTPPWGIDPPTVGISPFARSPLREAFSRGMAGEGTPEDRLRLTPWLSESEVRFVDWRRSSRSAQIPTKGTTVAQTACCLIAAAGVGERPEENLSAAARLAALLLAQPDAETQGHGAEVGIAAMEVARKRGRAREVDVLLGPAPDVRAALRAQLPRLFQPSPPSWSPSWRETLENLRPARELRDLRTIHLWRTLWREIPKGGSYAVARGVILRHASEMDALLLAKTHHGNPFFLSNSRSMLETLKRFEKLQRARRF